MLTKESPNFSAWNRVFAEIMNRSPEGPTLDGETPLVHEGANPSGYPEVFVLGIFTLPDNKCCAVSFRIDASLDEIDQVKFEIKEGLKDLETISGAEKRFIESKA